MLGRSAARSRPRAAKARTGAARANRATVSQPGVIQPRASFDSGTVRPQRMPAVARAMIAVRFDVFM
jgi:hypothetical protein